MTEEEADILSDRLSKMNPGVVYGVYHEGDEEYIVVEELPHGRAFTRYVSWVYKQ